MFMFAWFARSNFLSGEEKGKISPGIIICYLSLSGSPSLSPGNGTRFLVTRRFLQQATLTPCTIEKLRKHNLSEINTINLPTEKNIQFLCG